MHHEVKKGESRIILEGQESERIYAKAHYHELLLVLSLVIVERVLHEGCNGFPLTGRMHSQQLLECVCGEPHLLGPLLPVVLSCLLHSC